MNFCWMIRTQPISVLKLFLLYKPLIYYFVIQNGTDNAKKVKCHVCMCRDKDNCNVARINQISILCIVFAFGLKML